MIESEAESLDAQQESLIWVDAASAVPPYEQIREQLAELITSGQLAPGTRLPPIRQLAADLDLAPGTVARAYRALDDAGLTTGRARSGTTVAQQRQAPDRRQLDELDAAARRYAATVRALGLTPTHAIAAIKRHLGALPAE